MNEEQRRELANRVKAARQERGWTQATLALEAGVAENTVLSIEKGRRDPQPEKLRKVLDALGIVPTATVLELAGVPEDVSLFLTVALQRLRVMDENDRNKVLADLYPRLLIGK